MAGQDRKKSKKGGKPKGEAGPVISTCYANAIPSRNAAKLRGKCLENVSLLTGFIM